MGVPFPTWDGGVDREGNARTPYRPSLNDFDGANLKDDPKYPPSPGEHPTADLLNQLPWQAVALARVASPAKVSVTLPGGNPTIVAVSAPGTRVLPSTFTVTDMGVGVTKITAPAGTFPARVTPPRGPYLGYVAAPSGAHWGDIELVTDGVVVRTYSGTTLTDIPFSFDWE